MDAITQQPTTPTTPADLGMDASPVSLTPKAIEMVKDAMQREGLGGYGIRVGVMGGGCAGFQYSMDFEKEAKDGDVTFDLEGVKVFVDPMSSMYLQGVTIDYVVGLQGAGFKFNNPNARTTCGCGSSFSY
ncbi:MAG TPA: iron-sulfur cluster insertion protein ErpA [Anaeromyxobacter sp.]